MSKAELIDIVLCTEDEESTCGDDIKTGNSNVRVCCFGSDDVVCDYAKKTVWEDVTDKEKTDG